MQEEAGCGEDILFEVGVVGPRRSKSPFIEEVLLTTHDPTPQFFYCSAMKIKKEKH